MTTLQPDLRPDAGTLASFHFITVVAKRASANKSLLFFTEGPGSFLTPG